MVCAAGVAGDAMVCDPGIVGAWSFATQRADHGCRSALAESRPYVPVLFGGFGCLAQRFVGLGRPHRLQAFNIATMSA